MYDAFIEGAKGGIQTSLTVIPYLVGMLVGDQRDPQRRRVYLTWSTASPGCSRQLGVNADFVPALPTALMKPLSGSGAKAMMIDDHGHLWAWTRL